MRMLISILALAGGMVWIAVLRRRLASAEQRGDMYREIAIRLDRQLADHTERGIS